MLDFMIDIDPVRIEAKNINRLFIKRTLSSIFTLFSTEVCPGRAPHI